MMIKKNKFFLVGLPVIALAFGLMVAGCDDGSTDDAQGGGGTDQSSALIDIDGINSTESWNAALTRIKTGASKRYRLFITGDFGVPGSMNNTFGSRISLKGLSVEIAGQGTGRKISLTSNGLMLFILEDQHLTLKDITLQGKTDNNYPLVWVNSGTLSMEGSAAVSGNGNTNSNTVLNGGGVCLTSKSELTMSGNAVISGNTAPTTFKWGGGGGVYLFESSMTMSGNAAISGNKATNDGGGVYLTSKSTVTMSDNAQISGNSTTDSASHGGGVYLFQSTVTMSGNAAISGNETSKNGGGVYLNGTGAAMTMNDTAVISGNKAGGLGGGGVYLNGAGAAMTMNDTAVISGNKATGGTASYGGGIFVMTGAVFRITGGTVYGNNVAVESYKNTAGSYHCLYGKAERGIYNDSVWTSRETFDSRDLTITGNP